jgi:hypothetical protein
MLPLTKRQTKARTRPAITNHRLAAILVGVAMLSSLATFLSGGLAIDASTNTNTNSKENASAGMPEQHAEPMTYHSNSPISAAIKNPEIKDPESGAMPMPVQMPTLNGLKVDPSPSRLIKSVPGRTKNNLACQVEAPIDDHTYQVFQKIRRGILSNQQKLNAMPGPKPRILCLVYTHQGSHPTLQVLVDTWATQCDGFIAASNATDPAVGAMDLPHDGPEAYGNMWQKVKSMWKYANDHYLDDYDYFHICGDDTYILLDNLRLYLMGEQVKGLLNGKVDQVAHTQKHTTRWKTERPRPLLLGFPLSMGAGKIFAAGGSGYTLNKAAVKLLVHATSGWIHENNTDSREDLFVTSILAEQGVHTCDTRDKDGANRYVPNTPAIMWDFKHKYPPKFNIELHKGIRAFSNETVAMHLNYRKTLKKTECSFHELIYRYHDFFTGRCDEQLLNWQETE